MTQPWLSRLEVHPVGDGSFQLHAGGFVVAEGMPKMVAEALARLAAENERLRALLDFAGSERLIKVFEQNHPEERR